MIKNKDANLLIAADLSTRIKLCMENGIDLKYAPKLLSHLWTSCKLAPFKTWETLRYSKDIQRTQIKTPPIFIVGFWRSGTTYLHNLMTQDNQFGFCSTLHAFLPGCFIYFEGSKAKSSVEESMPKTRLLDSVSLSLDTPQEEEFAIANLSPYSHYHRFAYPQRGKEYLQNYILFSKNDRHLREKWKKTYLYLLKKLSYFHGGKQLILKNPVNTSRISLLLELFPQAKFIHIYRNPYEVYVSMLKSRTIYIERAKLQSFNLNEEEDRILETYKVMINKYFKESRLIPADNLIEIRYEDLTVSPLSQLQTIYERLNLPKFNKVKEKFERYIMSQKNYRKNKHEFTPNVIEAVKQKCSFTLEKWNYSEPSRLNPESAG